MDEALKSGGGSGTSGGMTDRDLHGRVSKLEGAQAALFASIGIVSAVLIGGMALLWSDVSRLEDKVDALPSEIRQEIEGLTSTIAQSITATRSNVQSPQVVIIPKDALVDSTPISSIPRPENPNE